ncbi:S8 family peptidase [Duganella sp. PWIR1]
MKLRTIPAAAMLLSGAMSAAQAQEARLSYLVQLSDKPVTTYSGGISGIAATQPPAGNRIDMSSANVQLYASYLGQKASAVKALVPAAQIEYDYKVVLNGFSARLTAAEVRTLQASSAVSSIQANAERHLDTSYTPTFLGLDGPGGLWEQAGGKEHAGEGIIVGIIDSGLWPENPAFADRIDGAGRPTFANDGTLNYSMPAGWHGSCQTGQGFTVANCNNKLIGARYFKSGFNASGNTLHWSDFISPRDSIGGTAGQGSHGTHTASTAAGNHGVAAQLGGMAMGSISGMAPRAHVAAYKVCWTYVDGTTPGKNSCWEQDSIAAIETAVSDGVHVLNYSISGGTTANNSVEMAFMNAASAGVFVAVSAGNDGPARAVNHVGPWLTTVAAAAHNHFRSATVTLGNGAGYTGASLNGTALLAGTPIIRSEDVRKSGASAAAASLCYSTSWNGGAPALDPALAAGKIVTCLRGTNDRVDKSLAVKQAGGVGMVLVDNGGGLVAELHSVPTVHVSAADGALIKAYAVAGGGTAALSPFFEAVGTGPVIAGFSSRGPNAYDANLLKPDLAAPGVDILAGATPQLTPAQQASLNTGTLNPVPLEWKLLQGTSMASPHVAGVGALLRQAHPTWSPAMIKSALMTSATPTFADAQPGMAAGALPWAQGAGHINPNGSMLQPAGVSTNPGGAIDPGLVFDIAAADYRKYLCGAGVSTQCSFGTMPGQNLNLPSITLNNVLGSASVTRTVTNVGASAATYEASIDLSGYTASVSPTSLSLAPGASANVTVQLARNGAPDDEWQYGTLTLSDGSHIVRVPVTARSSTAATAPRLIASTRAAGSSLLNVGTGFSGRMTTRTGGFKAVAKSASQTIGTSTLPVDTGAEVAAACNANNVGITRMPFVITADNVLASFELFNADAANGSLDDLDLALLDPSGELIDYSGHGGSNEALLDTALPAGTYQVCVIGYSTKSHAPTSFKLSYAVVARSDTGGNLRAAAPSQVYAGSTATVSTSWSGLASGQRYYGGVQLIDTGGAVAATTSLLVETNSPLPLVVGADRTVKNAGAK